MMGPLKTITNEQAYTILARISKAQESMSLEAVADGKNVSSWAKDGVGKAVASGYVTGFLDPVLLESPISLSFSMVFPLDMTRR